MLNYSTQGNEITGEMGSIAVEYCFICRTCHKIARFV